MNQLDPVEAAITVVALIFGPSLAAVIGPYSVIVVAASVGASWSIRRNANQKDIATISYFLLINFTAMLVTVAIAKSIGTWLKLEEPMYLLSPIALLIGGVGADWPRLLKWLLLRAVNTWRPGGKND